MYIQKLSPLLIAVCLLLATAAYADEWVIDRAISSKITHNDNVNMQRNNPLPDTNLALSPSLSLSSRTESRDVSVRVGTTINRYVNHPENNSIDYQATLNLKLVTELEQRSVTLTSIRDSTLNSELVTTGVVLARRQRTLSAVQASWQHAMNDKTSANTAYNLTMARYEEGPGLEDYNDQSVSAGLRHMLSERTAIGTSLSMRDYRTISGNAKSRVALVSVDGQMQYSERLQFNVDIGMQKTRTDLMVQAQICQFGDPLICSLFNIPLDTITVPLKSDSRGTTFNAGTSYKFESGSLSVQAGRGLNASGAGSLLSSDQIGMGYQYRFNETLSASIGASATHSQNLDGVTDKNRFTSFSESLNWQLDQWLSLSFGMTQATQTAAGQSQSTNANTFFLGLNYSFQPRPVVW